MVTTKREAIILNNQVDKLIDKKSSQKSSYMGLTEQHTLRRTSPATSIQVNASIVRSKCDESALTTEIQTSTVRHSL